MNVSRTRAFSVSLVALAAVVAFGQPNLPDVRGDLAERTLRILCEPEWAGRLTLSPGARAAADFLAEQFRSLGLQPGGTDGYFHEFDVSVNFRPTTRNLLQLIPTDGETLSLRLGTDYVPLVGTRSGALVRAPLTYVGYGLVQDGWNDYEGIDVRGRVVIALRGVPEGRPNATNGQKARWAAEAGAVGILFVGPSDDGRPDLPRLTRGQGVAQNLNVLAAGLSERFLERLTGKNFAEARSATGPASRHLDWTVRAVTEVEPNRGRCRNVIAVLPGNDPALKDEIIVVGAHYDHLGFGEVGSRTNREIPHLGADDNASGVAGVVALAEYFARTRSNRRTMIFQCYSGEEVGLVGALAWVRDHPEIVDRTHFMMNLDMIGRLRDGNLTVFSTSSAIEIDGILDRVRADGVNLVRVPTIAPNSDHAAFARANTPHVFLHTGLHPEYHTENDTVDTINFEGMTAVIRVAAQILSLVDDLDARMAWNPEARFAGRARPNQPPSGAQGQGRAVRLGLLPDLTESDAPGLLVTGVSPGSPAEKAGVKAGDRLLKIGDREIRNASDLQEILVAARPGQRLTLFLRRGDQELAIEVTLEAASGG